MKIKDLMTPNPAFCSPSATLNEVAEKMVERDCGEIPVCDDGRVVGVITDRDISCRTVARDINPLRLMAREVMSTPVHTIGRDEQLEKALRLMEEKQIRRLPVVEDGRLVGMLSQADIAEKTSEKQTGELLKEISRPARAAADSFTSRLASSGTIRRRSGRPDGTDRNI